MLISILAIGTSQVSAESLTDRVEKALAIASQDFPTLQTLEKDLDAAIAKSSEPQLELLRLQVMARAAETISADTEAQEPEERRWLERHRDEVFYNEIGGEYLVDAGLFWRLFERAKDSPLAERIAGIAASAPRGGECEGYLPCHVAAGLEAWGRYLREFPQGPNATGALAWLSWLDASQDFDLASIDDSDRAELVDDLAEWRGILEKTAFPRRDDMIRELDALLAAVRRP